MMRLAFILICLVAGIGACTATHSVRTVGKGNGAVEASFGGPVFNNLGGPIPAPNLFIGGRYGVRDDLDLLCHYNLTGPIVPGIGLNLIAGAQFVPIQPGVGIQEKRKTRGWSLSTKGQIHLLTDFVDGALVFPDIAVAGGYRYDWFNPYLGISFALHFFRPYDEKAPLFLSPFLGSDFIISEAVSLGLRITLLDVAHNMYASQTEWIHLVNRPESKKKYGMFSVALGFSYDIVRHRKSSQAPNNRGAQ